MCNVAHVTEKTRAKYGMTSIKLQHRGDSGSGESRFEPRSGTEGGNDLGHAVAPCSEVPRPRPSTPFKAAQVVIGLTLLSSPGRHIAALVRYGSKVPNRPVIKGSGRQYGLPLPHTRYQEKK